VIGDWREPNVIRMAPTQFYNSYEDVYEFVERLKESIAENKN
jgi:kynureninase